MTLRNLIELLAEYSSGTEPPIPEGELALDLRELCDQWRTALAEVRGGDVYNIDVIHAVRIGIEETFRAHETISEMGFYPMPKPQHGGRK